MYTQRSRVKKRSAFLAAPSRRNSLRRRSRAASPFFLSVVAWSKAARPEAADEGTADGLRPKTLLLLRPLAPLLLLLLLLLRPLSPAWSRLPAGLEEITPEATSAAFMR